MILTSVLPIIFLTGLSFSDNLIVADSGDAFNGANCFYSITSQIIECDKIIFNYDLETLKIDFNYLGYDINIFNDDNDETVQSERYNIVNFDGLSLELPYYTTDIERYELEFYVDDWNIYDDGTLEIFYNIDLFLVHVNGNYEGIETSIYRESIVDTSSFPSYFDVDQFLFEHNFDFSLTIANIRNVYNSLNSIYGDAYENGYESGSENGYEMGYKNGFDAGSGENKGVLNFIKSIFNTIDDLGNVEILPYIKIWYIIGIPVILAVVRFALGWFR